MIDVEVSGDLEYAIRQLKKKLQIDGIKRTEAPGILRETQREKTPQTGGSPPKTPQVQSYQEISLVDAGLKSPIMHRTF